MNKEPIYLGEMSVGAEQSTNRRAVWTGGAGLVVLDDLVLTGTGYVEIRATDFKSINGNSTNLLLKHVGVDDTANNWLSFALPPCLIEVVVYSPVSSSVDTNVTIYPI